jgi:CBS domain-containing protein
MALTLAEVMTHDPRTVDIDDTVHDAARAMRDGDVGALVVTETGGVAGIVTDRDIVVRAIADGRRPGETRVREVCTAATLTLTPDQSADEAVRLMRDEGIRRVPVVQDGRPAGIVSLGDLARRLDPGSGLADISEQPPRR